MSTYIITILTLSIISGIVLSLVPSTSRLKKQICFIVALISSIVFLSPIVSVLNNSSVIKNSIYKIADRIDIQASSGKEILNTSIENITYGIKKEIVNHFEFKDQDVEVTLQISGTNENLRINSVTVVLSNEAAWYDADKVKDYVEEITGCIAYITKR